MQSWTLIDSAPIPGAEERLRLLQRGHEFSINIDRNVLMGSRARGSEEALARWGCARAVARKNARVLIGGLGMGFTLRAALDLLGPATQIIVAELVPAVVEWVRGPLAALSNSALEDARVTVRTGDVATLIREARASFDAILLDVDNGPDGLTRPENNGLYDTKGLMAAKAALRPGGCLAVWSAGPNRGFTQRLAQIGFAVEELPVRAHGKRGLRHFIWIASR